MTALIAELHVPMVTRKIAESIAGTHFDEERSEVFRNTFPVRRKYIKSQWPYFVKQAREIMVMMLRDLSISETIKAPIYDALTNDHEVKMSKLSPEFNNYN